MYNQRFSSGALLCSELEGVCINMRSYFLGKALDVKLLVRDGFDKVHENDVRKRKLHALITLTLLVLSVLHCIW